MLPRHLFACLLILAITSCGGRPADPAPTLTPFQPAGSGLREVPHPTAVPTASSTPRVYATLQATPASTGTPAPAAPIPQPAGQVSILLLGADQRPDSAAFRTDTMVLLTLRADGTASLVSFPRDLYVYIPGFSMARINAAYILGGFDLLADTLEYNLGIRPQHFVLTNFNGFKSIVNALGGVDVNVGQWFHEARPGYPDGFTLETGTTHMDGEMALWYIRARLASSDLDRLRRGQEVLVAIGQRLLDQGALNRLPDFYEAYRQAVVTDLSLEDLLPLAPLLQAIGSDRVEHYMIGRDQVTFWTEPVSEAEYLLPIPDAVRQLLEQAVGIR